MTFEINRDFYVPPQVRFEGGTYDLPKNPVAQGFSSTTRGAACRICGLPVRIPKAGPLPKVCAADRELGRSLRRALSRARRAGRSELAASISAALRVFEAVR